MTVNAVVRDVFPTVTVTNWGPNSIWGTITVTENSPLLSVTGAGEGKTDTLPISMTEIVASPGKLLPVIVITSSGLALDGITLIDGGGIGVVTGVSVGVGVGKGVTAGLSPQAVEFAGLPASWALMAWSAPSRCANVASSRRVVDSPLPPTKLVRLRSTPPRPSPQVPKWMCTSSEFRAPGLRESSTSTSSPTSVRVAIPV